MAPDLRDYTQSKRKIPGQILGHGTPPIPKYKILLAHMLDFFMIITITGWMTALMELQMRGYLPTFNLHQALARIDSDPTTLFTLTIVAFSYFFCSLYLNSGQTWGMNRMKLRYPLESHKSAQTLKALFDSFSLYFSLGLTINSLQKKFVKQDYLYGELVQQREMPAPALIDSLEAQATTEENVVEFPMAA